MAFAKSYLLAVEKDYGLIPCFSSLTRQIKRLRNRRSDSELPRSGLLRRAKSRRRRRNLECWIVDGGPATFLRFYDQAETALGVKGRFAAEAGWYPPSLERLGGIEWTATAAFDLVNSSTGKSAETPGGQTVAVGEVRLTPILGPPA